MDLFLLQPGDPDILYGVVPAKIDGLPARDGIFDPDLCVPLISFGQGLKQQLAIEVGDRARPSGPPTADFTLVKAVDALSVRLYQFCLEGRSLGAGHDRPTYLHMLRDPDGAAALVISIALRDAMIGDIQLQSRPDGQAVEQLTLNATEMLWAYRLRADGRPTGEFHTGWSMIHGQPIISFTA